MAVKDIDVNIDAHFTLANIPFGIASRNSSPSAYPNTTATTTNDSSTTRPQISTRLHSRVFFLPELLGHNLLPGLGWPIAQALQGSTLNAFADLGRDAHRKVREGLQLLLSSVFDSGSAANDSKSEKLRACSASVADVTMRLPVQVGDFTDFSCSKDHVLIAGEAAMGVRSLPPGFLHFPIGYAGRCSSIVVSGTGIKRPWGQYRGGEEMVVFGPSKAMDFELEVGCVVGRGSRFGVPVGVDGAGEHVFGFVLVNDWSARDIQVLEMNPLGPLNGKSVGTSISPWIVTADALEPFRVAGTQQNDRAAPYLQPKDDLNHYALNLQVDLTTGKSCTTVCKSRLDWLYWGFRDMIAHQTINGCCVKSGDMLATGTVSGSEQGTNGCLLEITGGKRPLKVADGKERLYLEDGDGVSLTGWAGELGSDACVGFGDCSGALEPAIEWTK